MANKHLWLHALLPVHCLHIAGLIDPTITWDDVIVDTKHKVFIVTNTQNKFVVKIYYGKYDVEHRFMYIRDVPVTISTKSLIDIFDYLQETR
jgi:hypothetical protein